MVFAGFAVVAGMLAFGALSNLWADYRDSAISTYLVIGLGALAICAVCAWLAIITWRR
jgi:hypothetical protein